MQTAMAKKKKKQGHAANADTTWAITLGTRSLHLECTEQSEIYKLKLKHPRAGAWRSKAECSSPAAGQRPFSLSLSPDESLTGRQNQVSWL